jgi:SOS-response transcriptional repressor LexA
VATGLNNYELTAIDHSTLYNFKHLQWKEFRIGDLFERISTQKLPYKAKELSKQPTVDCPLPCLTSSFMNQGLNYYIPRKGATVLSNVISIPSNSDVYRAYYQSRDFTVLSDAYAIQWKDESVKLTGKQYLFMVACINKVTDLPIYSYKNKLGGWNVVKDKYFTLPTKDGEHPDLAAMEQLSATLQKIVIADVAKYTARNLEATQQVIEAQDEPEVKQTIIPLIHPEYKPGFIPLYTIRAACGYFGEGRLPEEEGWVDATGLGFTPDPQRHFAVHAKGDSMLPKIKDGDICIFEWYNAGSRNGEIVLSQISEYDDAYDGRYTIKRYHSEKSNTEDSWQHSKVELLPINPDFEPIELDEFGEYKTIGIFKCVL